MRSTVRFGFTGVIVAGAILLSGCGDDSDGAGGGSGAGGETAADVVVIGNDRLRFDRDTYTATSGTITIELVNDGTQPHTLLFDDDSIDFEKLRVGSKGDTDSGTVELPAGTYTIYCDVVGHRSAGMEATLVVN